MIKNLIVEMIENNEVKTEIYTALTSGKNVRYTTNLRATPNVIYMSDTLKIAIEPNKKTVEYFDKQIRTLAEAIGENKEFYKKGLLKMDNNRRIKAVENITINGFKVSSQYSPENIIQYILS